MSKDAPDGPYIFQPYGSVANRNELDPKRMWGIGGVGYGTTIDGLTKPEAECILAALTAPTRAAEGVRELREAAAVLRRRAETKRQDGNLAAMSECEQCAMVIDRLAAGPSPTEDTQ